MLAFRLTLEVLKLSWITCSNVMSMSVEGSSYSTRSLVTIHRIQILNYAAKQRQPRDQEPLAMILRARDVD